MSVNDLSDTEFYLGIGSVTIFINELHLVSFLDLYYYIFMLVIGIGILLGRGGNSYFFDAYYELGMVRAT